MARGLRPARRVLELAERCFYEPWSHARAHMLGGDEHWHEWLGYDAQVMAIKDSMDLYIAAHSDPKKGPPERVSRPTDGSDPRPVAPTLKGAFAVLSAMQQMG